MLPPISATSHQRISQIVFDPTQQERQNNYNLTTGPVLTPYHASLAISDQDKVSSSSSSSKNNLDSRCTDIEERNSTENIDSNEKTNNYECLDFGNGDYFSRLDSETQSGNIVLPKKSIEITTPAKIPIPPTPYQINMDLVNSARPKRRRREMQNISMIIETREFPYNDEYLWKNNGNTVHRKSGHKSIYYKCSNSSKGCSVNKTVTFKEDGEYLIKYRGQHLVECNRIKHIIDI
ncbi:hypothetical protein J3Q64DRAFT_1719285 [Phycomyces blakesleeanus]|uniref:WRKY domain-containing protein n=1 Tax=Phycomyces blakesleeanus TaxID=4837 RepID=A0ABR3B8Y2_PHYBL